MTLKLYDLVTKKRTGIFFSNNCSPVRLALLAKGIDFVTEEVDYPDLRFTWTPVLAKELGVEKATGACSVAARVARWCALMRSPRNELIPLHDSVLDPQLLSSSSRTASILWTALRLPRELPSRDDGIVVLSSSFHGIDRLFVATAGLTKRIRSATTFFCQKPSYQLIPSLPNMKKPCTNSSVRTGAAGAPHCFTEADRLQADRDGKRIERAHLARR